MFRRLSLTLVAILAIFSVLAPPASAGSSYMSRTSGKAANAYWTQVDGTPIGTQFGNVHTGGLYSYETTKNVGDVFVYIDDWDCQPGQLPYGGPHGESNEGCAYVGSRQGEGFGLALVINRKLDQATLRGTLVMTSGGGHDGPGQVVGRPAVDMVWTGFGSLSKSTSTYRYNDGTWSFSDRYSSTDRQSVMGGNLGPMTFAPDLSGGSISTFSSSSRGRS